MVQKKIEYICLMALNGKAKLLSLLHTQGPVNKAKGGGVLPTLGKFSLSSRYGRALGIFPSRFGRNTGYVRVRFTLNIFSLGDVEGYLLQWGSLNTR